MGGKERMSNSLSKRTPNVRGPKFYINFSRKHQKTNLLLKHVREPFRFDKPSFTILGSLT